jgi:elongation factor 1 alpha-like protein
MSPSWYFQDMPWGNIPKTRIANLVPPPGTPGGLLGGGDGAPKMSKLQALAAARKKKASDGSTDSEVGEAQKGVSLLSVSETTGKSNIKPSPFKRQRLNPADAPPDQDATVEATNNERGAERNENATRMIIDQAKLLGVSVDSTQEEDSVVFQASTPSAFAMTVFGSSPGTATSSTQSYLPYIASPLFDPNAFAEPSPDDIVLAAQAQGSRFGKTQTN